MPHPCRQTSDAPIILYILLQLSFLVRLSIEMFSQMLRQRLGLVNSIPTLQTRKASSLLKPRHPFFSPSTTRTMNRELDPITRTRLQFAQRFYNSGSYGSRSNGVMSAFYFLFAANAMVFGALNYAKYAKDWRLEKKLLNNTLLSPAAFDSGRWWTIITSAFAHIDPTPITHTT